MTRRLWLWDVDVKVMKDTPSDEFPGYLLSCVVGSPRSFDNTLFYQ